MRTNIKYTGKLQETELYQNKADHNVARVDKIFKDGKGVWVARMVYTDTVTKQNMSFDIPCYDMDKSIEEKRWIKLN